jgi:hypothetical protein
MFRSLLALLLLAAPAWAQTTSPNKFVPISQECMVRNTSGNCGFCSIEIIARHMGMAHMRGFAVGKGGCTASSMAGWLNKYQVKYKQSTNRAESIAIMREFLDADLPVLFSIPGHALVCHGWTNTPELGERIWVVDNTGREGCQMKGWTKAEFDRRFDGWVCGLFPIFPGRSPRVPPAPSPITPHVNPTPDLLANPLAKKVDELEARLKVLEKDDKTAPLQEKVSKLEGKLPEILNKVQDVVAQFGGVQGLLAKAEADLPRLGSLVDRLKADGVLTDQKAQKAHDILDKVIPFVGRVADVEKKIDPLISAIPWGTILGAFGGGTGFMGLIMAAFALFRRVRAARSDAPADPLALILAALQGLKNDKAPPAATPAPG